MPYKVGCIGGGTDRVDWREGVCCTGVGVIGSGNHRGYLDHTAWNGRALNLKKQKLVGAPWTATAAQQKWLHSVRHTSKAHVSRSRERKKHAIITVAIDVLECYQPGNPAEFPLIRRVVKTTNASGQIQDGSADARVC